MRQIAILVVSCAPALGADLFVDPRDGHEYPTVAIGSLVWMATNLAHPTPNSWCFDDQPDDCESNGRLYSWAAAVTACPKGWRLATDDDWVDLETALGMDPAQAFAQGPRGTNEGTRLQVGGRRGFNAPICGYRRPDGSYARRGERAAFWAASEHNEEDALPQYKNRHAGCVTTIETCWQVSKTGGEVLGVDDTIITICG